VPCNHRLKNVNLRIYSLVTLWAKRAVSKLAVSMCAIAYPRYVHDM
jgi:hypothetical protein